MRRREILGRARALFSENHIDDAAWEAELLLRDTLKIGRVKLYADFNRALTPRQEAGFWERIERRLQNEPSAYIVGHREFYGLDFIVDSAVLVPRPETELLVEKAIECASPYAAPVIVDVGTGCGAIAVSLAANLPGAHIYATDISEAALAVARQNCTKHGVAERVTLLIGDLLEPVPEKASIIVANLPYVRTADLPLVNTAGYEPRQALDGGRDGLATIRRLCGQVADRLMPGGSLLLEIGAGQKEAVVGLVSRLSPSAQVQVIPDISGIDRVVSLTIAT